MPLQGAGEVEGGEDQSFGRCSQNNFVFDEALTLNYANGDIQQQVLVAGTSLSA